ncbi:protein kinase domain-containing protein [Phosphitispora sp. TUW77]|uniref:protein kinase domain-containing protein n=1 Tax=Phosphitispora sp. TUW77 TaxID=3152361 RepID=UPI003AB8DB91
MGNVLKKASIISGVYGQQGEEMVSDFLAENLSDEYVILNSPRIYYHGATYDIDHIVIGPNGIFVIETKNMHGKIQGGMMGNWVQERRKSGKYSKVKIGNPANQVHQYAKAVKSYIGSRWAYENDAKMNIKVYSIVVFVHEDIDLTKMEFTKPGYIGRVKILKLAEMADYIGRKQGAAYTGEEINRMAELVVPVNQRDQTVYYSAGKLQELNESAPDRYEIFEEIGRGSFGSVNRGFDFKLDREIAVKRVSLSNRYEHSTISRFYREAQIASELKHKNIIGVYDYYEKSGVLHIIMEFVDGQSLDEYVKNNNVSVTEALDIMKEICSGVSYAHQKQVIHRDLKPSNILISHDGEVKVVDFGIAKIQNGTNLTMEGLGAGTPIIMSPEQIAGRPVTEKSDIFALGVLFYYLITGRLPFDGEYIGEIVKKISYSEPAFPRHYNIELTSDMESIILKALEKNPDNRFKNVAEMLKAIEEIQHTGKLSTKVGRRTWLKHIPVPVKVAFSSERKVFASITIISLLIFIGILAFQGYRDSRQLSQDVLLTRQYGFNNENMQLLFDNPKIYMGLSVNVVGRIEKLVKIDENNTQCTVSVRVGDQSATRDVIVSSKQPYSELQSSNFIEINGSIQHVMIVNENEEVPLIVADKVEDTKDPWSILAPAKYTFYPDNIVTQNNKVVRLEKIEFADQETRLYVQMNNTGSSDELLVLTNAVGKQAGQEFKELKNSYYGQEFPSIVQLQPNQEAKGVIFLEPMDSQQGTAMVILGSTNDVLMGQEPYIFDLKW